MNVIGNIVFVLAITLHLKETVLQECCTKMEITSTEGENGPAGHKNKLGMYSITDNMYMRHNAYYRKEKTNKHYLIFYETGGGWEINDEMGTSEMARIKFHCKTQCPSHCTNYLDFQVYSGGQWKNAETLRLRCKPIDCKWGEWSIWKCPEHGCVLNHNLMAVRYKNKTQTEKYNGKCTAQPTQEVACKTHCSVAVNEGNIFNDSSIHVGDDRCNGTTTGTCPNLVWVYSVAGGGGGLLLIVVSIAIYVAKNRRATRGRRTSDTYSNEDDDESHYDSAYLKTQPNNRIANRNRRAQAPDIISGNTNENQIAQGEEVINTSINPYYGVDDIRGPEQSIDIVQRTENPYYGSSNRNRRKQTRNTTSPNVNASLIAQGDELIQGTRNPYYGVDDANEPTQNIEMLQRTENPYYSRS